MIVRLDLDQFFRTRAVAGGHRCCVSPGGLIQRFRDQTNSENRLLRRVQKLHLPFAVFLEFAGNAADHIAANAGEFFPGCIAVGELCAEIA